MPSGLAHGSPPVRWSSRGAERASTSGRGAGPRSSSGCSCAASPSSWSGTSARPRPSRSAVVDRRRSACRRRSRGWRPPRAGPRRGRPPHSAYAVSVPARQTTWSPVVRREHRLDAVGRTGRRRRRLPPAASRLVAKVARAVCAATGAQVARKTGAPTGSSRSASKAAAVATDVAVGVAGRSGSVSPRFGNSLSPVSGRRRVRDLPSRTAATSSTRRAASRPASASAECRRRRRLDRGWSSAHATRARGRR